MVIFGPRRSCPSSLPGPRARLWRIDLRHATLLVDLHAGIRAVLLADEAKPVHNPNAYQKARQIYTLPTSMEVISILPGG